MYFFGDFMFIERSKIRDIADKITSWLASDGFECVDLDWDPQPRNLTVYVDHPKGVGFEECVAISERLVAIEELDQLIPCEFTLEVSSPGIERPLRTFDHFKEAFKEKAFAEVKLEEKVNNRKNGKGQIIDFSDTGELTLKTAEGIWTFPIDKVLKATKLADWDVVTKNAKELS